MITFAVWANFKNRQNKPENLLSWDKIKDEIVHGPTFTCNAKGVFKRDLICRNDYENRILL